tara:strand:- start:314 stop:850 length:537 start_codon:yes stop_codon:yes gene_type:complete
MAQFVLDQLCKHFPEAVEETSAVHGNETAYIKRDAILEVAKYLRDDASLCFDMPIDCTALDWQNKKPQRFEVVYHIYSTTLKHRLRLKVRLAEEDIETPALTQIWKGMNWHERECWDMYGVVFTGHPKLKRVLLYEEFEGFPLRKDYPVEGRQPLIEMRDVKTVPTEKEITPDMLNRP